MIRDAAIFSLNEIVLRPEGWPLFAVLAEEPDLDQGVPPAVPGVYALALPRHYLSYPGGSSRVLYIGRAITGYALRGRLREHLAFTIERRRQAGDTGRHYARYEWAAVHGLQATWAVTPNADPDDTKRMEARLIYWFAELYGAVPLGNTMSHWYDQKRQPRPEPSVFWSDDEADSDDWPDPPAQ